MENIIETMSLCKNYGKHKVLKELNLHVPKGSIYGLVGKNGAGKTTFMRVICGLQPLSSGEYTICGVKSSDKNIMAARSKVAAVIENPSFYPSMTARENMLQQYRLMGIPSNEGIDELLEMVGLSNTGKKKVKNFSLGMKQRLGIAMTLSGNPDCILLDEPMNGLDPEGIIEIRETIIKLNKEKDITFIISSHILDELSKVATTYGFIKDGQMVKEIPAEEVMNSCRKYSRIVVNDSKILAGILEGQGASYVIESDEEIIVYGEFDINFILSEMVEKNCKLKSYETSNESLESFYLNIMSESNGGNQ